MVKGQLLSAQVLQGRLQFRYVEFAKQLLNRVLEQRLTTQAKLLKSENIFSSFKRVFLEDSSCFYPIAFYYEITPKENGQYDLTSGMHMKTVKQ
jgi:hypothetical protein